MPTLLLRLAAPLQSWGSNSKFEIRTTEKMPTKSGVVGMLAAALGWGRNADLSELTTLKFGVRADREGEDITDFHTVHSEKSSYVTYRHYLSDAVFLAGLEGEKEYLKKLETALQNPKFALFLGRRSCPPTLPIVLGIRDLSLKTALCNEAPLDIKSKNPLHIWIETDENFAEITQDVSVSSEIAQDVPVSFNPARRIYGYRKVKKTFAELNQKETEHDAMAELGG